MAQNMVAPGQKDYESPKSDVGSSKSSKIQMIPL